jgi:hypothetical protein
VGFFHAIFYFIARNLLNLFGETSRSNPGCFRLPRGAIPADYCA